MVEHIMQEQRCVDCLLKCVLIVVIKSQISFSFLIFLVSSILRDSSRHFFREIDQLILYYYHFSQVFNFSVKSTDILSFIAETLDQEDGIRISSRDQGGGTQSLADIFINIYISSAVCLHHCLHIAIDKAWAISRKNHYFFRWLLHIIV